MINLDCVTRHILCQNYQQGNSQHEDWLVQQTAKSATTEKLTKEII